MAALGVVVEGVRGCQIYSGGSLAFSLPDKTFSRVIGRRWGRGVRLMRDTTFLTLSFVDPLVSSAVKMVEAEAPFLLAGYSVSPLPLPHSSHCFISNH